jgi:DNA-binding SARP family transcriptional activator/TolB-like protein
MALLAYLAAAVPHGPQRRDTLLALFWPEVSATKARASLSQTLYSLRNALGEQAIVTHGDDEVGVSRDVVWCDAQAFEVALDADRPDDALALYRGELLTGFFLSEAPEFERWVERERERLRGRAADAAWAWAEARAAAGDTAQAVRWAHWAAALAPADEAVIRRLMTFLSRLGDRAAALRAYEAFAFALSRDFELEPSAQTSALAASIREAPHAADRWQSAAEILGQLGGMSTPVISSGTADAIRRGHPARVATLFASASAGVLGVVYLLIRVLGLPDWVFGGAVVLLLLGFPIVLVTGHLERRRAQARATGRVSATPPGGLHGLFTWPRAILSGVVAFAALGVGTLGWTLMRGLGIGPIGTLVAKGRLAEKDRLVVADFANHTADPTLGQSLTEAFRIDLAQTRVVTLVSSAAVGEALARMQRSSGAPLTADLAREVATREGAKAVVTGEISTVGQGFVLSTRLLNAADGSELVALRETAADDRELIAALDRLSNRLRERIGESLRTIRAGQPLERVTTTSLAALKLYSDGVRAHNQGDYARAERTLEQALALDSNFAMAWRKLGVSRVMLGASPDLWVAALRHAYELNDRLPETERLFTIATYQKIVAQNLDAAEAAYRRLLELDPNDPNALGNLGEILGDRGEYAAADSLEIRANEFDPAAVGFTEQMWYELGQADTQQARHTLARFEKAFPGYDYAFARAWFQLGIGAYGEAQRELSNIGLRFREPGHQADVHQVLAALHQLQGHLTEAERQYRELARVEEQRTDVGDALAAMAQVAIGHTVLEHDTAGALKVLDSALAHHPLDQIPPFSRPYVPLIMAYAFAGQTTVARRLLAEYRAARPEEVRNRWGAYLDGYAALAEHRPREAIAALRPVADGRVVCVACGFWALGRAYEQVGQSDSALAAYEQVVNATPIPDDFTYHLQWALAPSLRRLGELYEAKGDRANAVVYYRRFVDLWKDADPPLQPAVREAKGRLARLVGDGH